MIQQSLPPAVEKLCNPQLRHQLAEIRRKAIAAVDPPVLRHYTNHGERHLDRVAENFVKLSTRNRKSSDSLNKYEIFVGLASCYLHDVALQSVIDSTRRRLDNLHPEDYDEIRRRHPKAAAEWIRHWISHSREEIKLPDIGVAGSQEIRDLCAYVARLVELHAGPPEQIPSLPDSSYSGCKIRLSFLLRLLRLSDGLDLDCTRVQMDHVLTRGIPILSMGHWWRHHYTNSVEISDRGEVRIHMVFPPSANKVHLDYFVNSVEEYISPELESAQEILRANETFIYMEPIKYTCSGGEGKMMPPTELDLAILKKSRISPASAAVPEDNLKYSIGGAYRQTWGVQGNPWTDLPVGSEDPQFIETETLRSHLQDLNWLGAGQTGELRFVLGQRGVGKTSFLASIKSRIGRGRGVYVDMGFAPNPITTPEQLYGKLFGDVIKRLGSEVSPTQAIGPAEIENAVVKLPYKKPVILIDNLDRFQDEPDEALIKRFFQLSQGNLSVLKRHAVVIISASDSWRPFLESSDLSYIGPGSLWYMSPFSVTEIRELLGKRLVLAGSTFERVFEPGVERLIHHHASGNPRKALQSAQLLCEMALSEKNGHVTLDFVNEILGRDLDNQVVSHAVSLARNNREVANALSGLYNLYDVADRSGATRETVTDLICRAEVECPMGIVPESLRPALKRVCDLKSKIEGGLEIKYWNWSIELEQLFKMLKSAEISPQDFLSSYIRNPVRPSAREAAEKDTVLAQAGISKESSIWESMKVGYEYIEQAQEPSLDPSKKLALARFGIEHVVVSALANLGHQMPHQYRSCVGLGNTTTNRPGVTRPKKKEEIRIEGDRMRAVLKQALPSFWGHESLELLCKTTDEALTRQASGGSSPSAGEAQLAAGAALKVRDDIIGMLKWKVQRAR